MSRIKRIIILSVFAFIVSKALYSSQHVEDNLSFDSLKDSIEQFKREGINYARQGALEKAKELFRKELKYKKKTYSNNHPQIAHTYVNLGVVYKEQGRLDEALKLYEKAKKIYRNASEISQRKTGTNYQNMANIYALRQDFEKAENYYRQALNLFKKDSLDNLDRIGMIYNNLGIVFKNQNRLDSAIHFYKQSIELKKMIGNTNLTSTYGNIANFFRIKGALIEAEKYFRKTIKHGTRHYGNDSYKLSTPLLNFGLLQIEKKEFKEAKDLLNQSLKIKRNHLGKVHPQIARAYENLGYLFTQQGKYQEALNYFQRALTALSENFSDTTSLYSNPDIEHVSSKPILINILKYKATAITQIDDHRTENLQAALDCYKLALQVIRELRMGYQTQESKLSLTANERETFIKSIKTATELYKHTGNKKYLKEAFRHAEESKAAVLYEAIQTNRALSFSSIPDSMLTKESELKKQIWTHEELIYEEKRKRNPDQKKIDYWKKNLFQLNRNYENLVKKFEEHYPKYYSLKYEQTPLELQTIQEKMGSRDALIEYVLTNDRIYAFLIEKNAFDLKTLSIDTNFTEQVLSLRSLLSDRNFSTHTKKDFQKYNTLAYNLYNTLIKPLDIPENKKLTIIPDDILSYLPFEILVTEKRTFEQISYNDLSYLIKDHDIGYSYSAKVLYNNIPQKRNPENKLAAFAPTYNNIDKLTKFNSRTRQEYREKLYPLKGIKKEAQRITRIINGDAYMDQQATEDVFKDQSGDYDILHLAMHTLVNDEEPMYSKMAFTQREESKEDGFLNTYEIYNLELDSRLAVLSSCNTGTGKLQKGEGIISLARGFKYAGCPSIIMTMWPVEDNSSIRLMEYFYEAIHEGKNKDHALRKAKLKFLENSDPLHAHPYFWAGYIVIGDTTPLYKSYWRWWIFGGTAFLIIIAVLFFTGKRYLRQVF
ncbi:MAG: CHAT domain-containing protein [Bacteroidales bacterium]|nr:CHAT domain-containing protein [Bacteroidales bacterium]